MTFLIVGLIIIFVLVTILLIETICVHNKVRRLSKENYALRHNNWEEVSGFYRDVEPRKKLSKARMALYVVHGANASGYANEHEMIEHLKTVAGNIYEDTK